MKFTDQIADYIYQNQIDLNELCIVIPSKRAQKYIASSLYEKYRKPIFAPQMLTIDEWVKEQCTFHVVDKTSLLFQLYKVHLEIEKNIEKLTFDAFQKWGDLLLKDFDEIDRYLLNYKDVFRNLSEIHRLEDGFLSSWNVEEEELSKTQKKFLSFWKSLPNYYLKFQKTLSSKNINYSGRAYRFAAENIETVFNSSKKDLLFAGFNALSTSEKEIIKYAHRHPKGHVLIDADQYYLNDKNHEAGSFLRQLLKSLNSSTIPFIKNQLQNKSLNIEIIECPQVTGQVKVASTILNNLLQEELNKTVLLLADESLIIPVIQNIPKKVKKANITLGLPLKSTPVKSWVELLFSIQENKKRFSKKGLYFKDFQRFCNHPFIQAILNEKERDILIKEEEFASAKNQIIRELNSLKFCPHLYEISTIINKDWNEDWLNGISQIRIANEKCFGFFKEQHIFEKATIHSFDEALIELQNISAKDFPKMGFNAFRSLFKAHAFQKKISYHGNPMEGLQVMGLLETRMIDFDTIIVVGMNEGVLPNTNPLESFFPMDLRRYLGLPLPRQKQGLFAYHFYRLLHEAKNLYCTFASVSEGIGKAEASRYLLQLELELLPLNPSITLSKKNYKIPTVNINPKENQILKDANYYARLDSFFKRSLSASAINTFLNCPKDFYNKYILEFEEDRQMSEELENSAFGSFIHDVLEELYTPHAMYTKDGQQKKKEPYALQEKDMDKMLNQFEELMHKSFKAHFGNNSRIFASGKNRFSYDMALELTKRILNSEKKILKDHQNKICIHQLEAKLETSIEININGHKKPLHLNGRIDRIDSLNGKVRVIDYKSGKIEDKEVTFSKKSKQSAISSFSNCKHATQLIMYCVLYQNKYGKLPDVAGIYSVINQEKGVSRLKSSKLNLEEIVSLFPVFLEEMIKTLYDPNIPIEHNEKAKYCSFC